MHQRVVIGPGADAIEPAFEQLELRLAELADHPLQHQDGEDLFFQDVAAKELIGNLQQIRQVMLRQDGPPKAHRNLAQLVRCTSRATSLRA